VSTPAQHVRDFLHCRVLRPLLRLANGGASHERIAWSLAIGLVIGINPILGTTTVAMLALAWVLRLNVVASQIGTHAMTPLQLLLFLPFVKAGTLLFHDAALPMSKKDIIHLSHRHPLQLIRLLWQWEWHALVVWAVLSAIVAPLLATQIRKALVLSTRRHKELLVS
jgi:uncharacterized protein (DUF2062 family)